MSTLFLVFRDPGPSWVPGRPTREQPLWNEHEFVRQVFDAIELERFEFGPESFHVEMQVGDSTIVIEAGELPPDVKPWLGSVYVYVADVDAVHSRALSLRARLLAAVEDKPYQERQGSFIDSAGNTWWVATYKP